MQANLMEVISFKLEEVFQSKFNRLNKIWNSLNKNKIGKRYNKRFMKLC